MGFANYEFWVLDHGNTRFLVLNANPRHAEVSSPKYVCVQIKEGNQIGEFARVYNPGLSQGDSYFRYHRVRDLEEFGFKNPPLAWREDINEDQAILQLPNFYDELSSLIEGCRKRILIGLNDSNRIFDSILEKVDASEARRGLAII
jgi:hypothetical protein